MLLLVSVVGAPLSKYRHIRALATPAQKSIDGVPLRCLLPSREDFEEAYRNACAVHCPVATQQVNNVCSASVDLSDWLARTVTHPFFGPRLATNPNLVLLVRGDAFPAAGRVLCQLCITILNLGWWSRTKDGTWPLVVADCADSKPDQLRTAFATALPVLQMWIDTQADPRVPGFALRVMLGGDEKFLRVLLGISPSRYFLSVYSAARFAPRTNRVVDSHYSHSSYQLLRNLAQRTATSTAATHRGANHMPLLQFPVGTHRDHVVIDVLHTAIALGRYLAVWVEANTSGPQERHALARACGVNKFSLNLKGDDARILFRNFHLAAPHLLPGTSSPGLVQAVQNLGWAVDRLTFAFIPPGHPELLAAQLALKSLPQFVQAFRRELGLDQRSHYLHYLEVEAHRIASQLVWLGLLDGLEPQLGAFSADMSESLNYRLKMGFLR